jgi:DNA-binding NtrC family response regulator
MTAGQPLCLIVDADEAHASALEGLCREQGFAVRRAVPDEGLLGDIAVGDADLAFVDGALGLEAMSHLADTSLADAELFAMAAEDDTVFAQDCIRAGFSFFFRKPFEAQMLLPLLADIAAEAASQKTSANMPADDNSMVQFGLMRGSSKGMRKLFRTLRKIGPTDRSSPSIARRSPRA